MQTPPAIDYYFSVMSPWAYLGDQRFQNLAQRFNATVTYHPLSSPDLFPATGGQLLKDRAQHRKDYRLVELERWRKRLSVPLTLNPKHFPTPEAPASKLILAVQDAGLNPGPLVSAIFKAVWTDDLNISDAATLTTLATNCGLDGEALLSASAAAPFDAAFTATTQAAIARGVFGYPTYVLNNELFWGQDRLDFVERALEKS